MADGARVPRALITGAAGFVGRYIHRALDLRGWDVVPVDLVTPPARHVQSVRAHVTRADANWIFDGQFLPDARFDLVVHCAYRVGGRIGIERDLKALALNVQLDAGLFAWAVRTRQPRVLYFSSSAAYPVELQGGAEVTSFGSRYREFIPNRAALYEDDIDLDDVKQPDARYGWAKLTGEQLARAASAAGLAVHVVRPFSGYGADQAEDYPFAAIAARVRTHIDGEPFEVWGPKGQTRDWIHITDVVEGALAVVAADERRPVNLCTGVATEFGDLARFMLAAAGKHGEITYREDMPTGVLHRTGNPARMHTIYKPTITLAEGVSEALRG